MIHSLAENIALFFSHNGIIKNEDTDIYEYGLELVLSSFINIAGIIILMLISKLYIETILYFLGFSFLRVTAGGYHAKTHLRCFVMSIGIYAISMMLINLNIPFWGFVTGIIIMLSIVILLSPVEDENKPLNTEERKILRMKSLFFAIVVSIAAIILHLINAQYALCIALGFAGVVFSLLLAVTVKGASKFHHKII